MRIWRDFSSTILTSKWSQIWSSPSHRLLRVYSEEALLSAHPVFTLPCASAFGHWDWMLGQRDLWSDLVQLFLTVTSKHFIKLYFRQSASFATLLTYLEGLRFFNYKWLPKEEIKYLRFFLLWLSCIKLYRKMIIMCRCNEKQLAL